MPFMKEEDMEDMKPGKVVPVKDLKNTQNNIVDREKLLKSFIERMHVTQRKYGMEMVTIKGQARAYLFAMELKEAGFRAEDIK